MTISRVILKVISIFIIGTVGGIFADQILWPYFIERPLFYEYRLEQAPVYVTERKEVKIQENIVLQEAIEKVKRAVIGVRSKLKNGKTLEGSGLIVTSDGLILTINDLLPQGANFYFLVEGKYVSYQILKRNLKDNLALVKVDQSNLPTAGFADLEKLKLGERIFLVGMVFNATGSDSLALPSVNEGIIKKIEQGLIQTNIVEENNLAGSPLFNIDGNLVGLVTIKETGGVEAISVNKIRQFLGF